MKSVRANIINNKTHHVPQSRVQMIFQKYNIKFARGRGYPLTSFLQRPERYTVVSAPVTPSLDRVQIDLTRKARFTAKSPTPP